MEGRAWARDRRERTRKLIELGGLVIVAGLHTLPRDMLLFIANRISENDGQKTGLRQRLDWARRGQHRFSDYENRGRWENASPTHWKCVMGGILNAAGLAEWPPATLLGALLDMATRIRIAGDVVEPD